MLITCKSLVVHEFPAKVCCGGVSWVSVPSGVVGCGSVWLLHMSLCVYCISRLRFSDIGGMAEVDEQRVCVKFCVRLGKTGSETWTSSQAMKASFMLTTQRQNCNLHNGRVLGLQDPKKHVCKKANWRRCSFLSLTKRGSYTGNLSHLEWQSMRTSTVMF